MIRQFELVEKVKAYDPAADEDALNRAYVFAMKAHGAQTRASGDPYFSHPLEVSGILSELGLDSASIVTGLLHDTLEDTETTLPQLKKLFGRDIAELVDGVTKLTRLELQSDKTKQAENFRKLLLAMSRDIRVLLVKLADRLHNMRTLQHIQLAEKRAAIARETMDIYAPLAERIGMHQIKDELEDLAFAELNPDAWAGVLRRLAFLNEKGEGLVERIMARLTKDLKKGGITAVISGRQKTPYSIWRKMQTKSVTFEMLSDIMAFRIVVDTGGDCYQTLGVLHGHYSLVPGRFKDYISMPKPNGYQSLHTSVVGPEGQRIEVQIRTTEMHDIAERGVAAHWQYRQGKARPAEGKQYRWLQELLEILDSAGGPEEFLEHTKLEMFRDQVFCFSPKGEVYGFPRGATVIDFAYGVHSEIGDHCVGAKVNGRMVPLRTVLENGDQIEILTSKAQTPSPEWEQMVVTGKARSRIRRFVHHEQRRQYVNLGKEIVEKAFRREHRDFSRKAVRAVAKKFHGRSADDVFSKVGEGLYSGADVVHTIYPDPDKKQDKDGLPKPRRRRKADGKADAIEIKGLIPGMAMHLAKCCYPLPGDRIVGIVNTGKGVTIHTMDCDTLQNFADTPERWLAVAWNAQDDPKTKQVSRLHVILSNETGSLGDLATVVARHESNISNLKITNRNIDFFDMILDIEVSGVRHLADVVAALRATAAVASVERGRH